MPLVGVMNKVRLLCVIAEVGINKHIGKSTDIDHIATG
jgi:hypothetical protein